MIDIKKEKKKNYFYLNIYIEKEKIGYLEYQINYETLDITDFFIEENYRKKGYGTLLLKELEKEKIEKIMLEVNKENIPALNLYKKSGFIIINVRKNYYKDKDALIMVKYLKDIYLLAVETSCDETSVSIC